MGTRETKIYLAILVALAVFIILVIAFIANIIKDRRALDASYKQKAARDTNAMDQDRARIGLDLHDDIGASLSSIKLQLECITEVKEEDNLKINKLVAHLGDIIQNLKRISYDMIPAVLQRKGLDAALKELLSMMKVPHGMKIEYDYSLNETAPDRVVHIYRLTQEILNNAVKHSRAGLLKIHFSQTKNTIILSIKDDGIGFSKKGINSRSAGLGLRSIASRALLLNAEIFLETQPGHGTGYQIIIPI